MSFDEIFDLTAGVYFNFYIIYIGPNIGPKESKVNTIKKPNFRYFFMGTGIRWSIESTEHQGYTAL